MRWEHEVESGGYLALNTIFLMPENINPPWFLVDNKRVKPDKAKIKRKRDN